MSTLSIASSELDFTIDDLQAGGNQAVYLADGESEESPESPILNSHEAYGCQLNNLSVSGLFGLYHKAGFLYPAKWQLLAPYMSIIKENRRRALQAGDSRMWSCRPLTNCTVASVSAVSVVSGWPTSTRRTSPWPASWPTVARSA